MSVENVPEEGGVILFFAILQAIASVGALSIALRDSVKN
jgi:hypothetical protein